MKNMQRKEIKLQFLCIGLNNKRIINYRYIFSRCIIFSYFFVRLQSYDAKKRTPEEKKRN